VGGGAVDPFVRTGATAHAAQTTNAHASESVRMRQCNSGSATLRMRANFDPPLRTSEDNVVDLSVEILKQIRGELRGLRGDVGDLRGDVTDLRTGLTNVRNELAGTNQRLDTLNRRFEVLEDETIKGFSGVHRRLEQLNDRVDGIHEIAGER
jgi:hypothetical protein